MIVAGPSCLAEAKGAAVGEVLLEREGGVAKVTISSPSTKNAMTAEMFDEFARICREVDGTPDDRVLLVTGAGGDFCSGADLKSGGGEVAVSSQYHAALARMKKIHSGALALHWCSKPTIAAVRGVAVGAGANLALGCDIVYASETARFSQIFVKRGLVLDYGGSYLLPRLVGVHKAFELALTGDMVDAPEAERIGLVNKVVPDGVLDADSSELALRITKAPPIQTMLIKQNLRAGAASSMESALEAEAHAQSVAMGTEDLIEAMAAWLQKREPEFKGR
ncbi:MAG: enoyl-CoA hydratase [Acidobacteria bacterium]|nr:MAG: enoyl-CoA hydratase [Acidobacteriota bacterium]